MGARQRPDRRSQRTGRDGLGQDARASYANHYLPNGAVVVPVAGDPGDEAALARLAEIYPDRRVVGVPGTTIACGGGGPHCITQQLVAGIPLPG